MIRAATSHILSLLPMPTRPRALLSPSPSGFRARTRTYPDSRAQLRDCSWGWRGGQPNAYEMRIHFLHITEQRTRIQHYLCSASREDATNLSAHVLRVA